jgi:excisionase family DNA binding protein
MLDHRQKNAEEVLNADEASAWLRIPKSTLYKLCTDGDVPAAKVGRHWRFHRDTLERWLLDRSKPTQAQKPKMRT